MVFYNDPFKVWFIKRDQKSTRDWTDLHDLLPSIAERLGLFELLRFRAVCKHWYAASSGALDKIETVSDHEPWFLLYGDDNSTCTLITESEKHTTNIPELNGTTCLSSRQGWLLLFREGGSIFFFCPLSRAKIHIPVKFPHSVISNHVASFTAPPTSKNCSVGIFNRATDTELELHVIHRGGASSWTKYKLEARFPRGIHYAVYHKGYFLFIDKKNNIMAYFHLEKQRLCLAEVIWTKAREGLRFCSEKEKNQMKARLALDDMCGVSICGTTVSSGDGHWGKMVGYENSRDFKKQGAWFQPRFHQISENQSWW
ncbi:hypothetical protein F3Y22_tig00116951pilonHSYRG00535 [Hibiscus syriacus]|uniref:F-box domain-containing protein n=1 Tax=Hibiscus syriacus TaxID=106335 RepID=A0A6A2WMN8_HIBSY|nr:hypothetical protein F3Y22_tig00116951pilonHSYRG00535 [Hibiscus syriacus]